jgi:hypothetical protein
MQDGKLYGVIIIEDKASGISALQTIQQSAPPAIANLLISFTPSQASKAAHAAISSRILNGTALAHPNIVLAM